MKIAILDGAVLNPGDVDWSPITSLGDVSIYDTTPTEAVAERTRGMDVVLVNKTPLTGPNLEQLDSSVRMVGVLATGYNIVDTEALAARGIPVCNVVAYGVSDVAQHAMALLLEQARGLFDHHHRHSDIDLQSLAQQRGINARLRLFGQQAGGDQQRVQPLQRLQRPAHHAASRGCIGQVQPFDQHPRRAAHPQVRGDDIETMRITTGEVQGRASDRQLTCDLLANRRGSAKDQNPLSAHVLHFIVINLFLNSR